MEDFLKNGLAGWKAPKQDFSKRETDDAIEARLTALVGRQVDYFTSRCKRTDLIFLIDLLEQWESLTDNDTFWENTKYPLAAAAEIQLDVMRRREKERLEYEAEKASAA